MTAIWSKALRRLASKIAPQNFDLWIRPVEFLGIEGRTIVLQASNPYVRLWFETNYLPWMLGELRSETGLDYRVEFLPEPNKAPEEQASGPEDPRSMEAPVWSAEPDDPLAVMDQEASAEAPPRTDPIVGPMPGPMPGPMTGPMPAPMTGSTVDPITGLPPSPTAGISAARRGNEAVSSPLNPRYTFDTFVAGPSNQLAYAAAQAAASSSPPKYNPIFICGGVGLGKTHLLHAIGHCFQAHQPGTRVLYLSGERFMNEYVHAIRRKRMHDFRRRYRDGCDVLLVDDVQFLAGKDGTQDEFFHTFNALHDSHRQIVLTADRKPHEISDIADRLRTRFAWGLLADVEPPELEVRIAILRQKAAAESIYLPDDVALYIGSSIKSNVRELEGALIRLAANASLSRREITLDFARETLEGSLTRPREHLTVEAILKSVANYYGLKVSDLKSSSRQKAVAGPRAVAMYLARTHTKGSYPDLGRAFGGKHHTTVISAVEKVTGKLKADPGLRGEIQAIEGVLLR